MSKTLYDLLEMKRENSILKSVFLSKGGTWGEYDCPINVEAYDDTFNRATETPAKQDKTCETITNAIIRHQDAIKAYTGVTGDTIDVMHYSTFDRHFQDLVRFREEDRIAYAKWLEDGWD